MKEKIFILAKYLIYIVAVSQLALSQVHIDIITKVFEPTAGFFLFLFIIFGLLMAFNSSAVKKGSRVELFIFGCIAAVAFGILYLRIIFRDIQADNILTFDEASFSIVISIISIVIYAFGTATMLVTGNVND